MGLLSRLRPRPAAAPAPLWRRGDFTAVPLGAEIIAVQRRGRPVVNAPAFLVEFIQECTDFRPLEKALAEHAESRGWESLQVAALRDLLPQAAADGLLISTEELHRAALQSKGSAPPPPLATLGISTGGDRLPLLERAVRSFAENLRTYGRAATLLISENSRQAAQAERSREALRSWSADYPELSFRFAGEMEKRRFAERLQKAGACSPEVAEFALLDPLSTGFSVGANRNALLLQGAGTMLASLDDDAVCRLAAPPGPPAPDLACYSDTDPYDRWLSGSRAETLAAANWGERDYLGEHERLLGRTGAEVFAGAGEIDYRRTGDALVQRLLRGPARVLATYAGHLGDPGIPTSAYFLYYDGENRQRLVASAAHYRAAFPSRSLLGLSRSPAVGDATVCPGIAMALDHRELLPPFFPVLHAEDYSYGALLWRTRPEALLGHLPLAVYHEPGEGKAILTPAQLRAGPPFVLFEFAHLLRQIVLRATLPEEGGTAACLRALGRQLQDLGALPAADFQEVLREEALKQAGERIAYLAHELEHHPELPGYWREDVQGLIAHLQNSTTAPDFDLPLDLQGRGAAGGTRAFMQSLLGRYGDLLLEWPGMVEAARNWEGGLMPRL